MPTQDIVDALRALIADSDLLLSGASLHAASTLLTCHPSTAESVSQKLLPPALQLAQSPLLQVSFRTWPSSERCPTARKCQE